VPLAALALDTSDARMKACRCELFSARGPDTAQTCNRAQPESITLTLVGDEPFGGARLKADGLGLSQ